MGKRSSLIISAFMLGVLASVSVSHVLSVRAQQTERPGNSLDNPIDTPRDLSGLSDQESPRPGGPHHRRGQGRRLAVSAASGPLARLSVGRSLFAAQLPRPRWGLRRGRQARRHHACPTASVR